jgi:hypothetical protein
VRAILVQTVGVALERLDRAGGPEPTDQALERAIETLLERRRPGATICPSEAARAVASDRGEPWRPLVRPAMDAAARLAAQGRVEVTQTGKVVDMATARGPVRIRVAHP